MQEAHRQFAVTSYNVLCQKTMERTADLYPHLDHLPQMWDWNVRKEYLKLEFQDLLHAGTEVFCLQEVQSDHFSSFYHPWFQSRMLVSRNFSTTTCF